MFEPIDQVKYLALNWHRDENGIDLTQSNGVSLGAILTCVFWQGFSSVSHYYERYQNERDINGHISLPSDSSRMSLFVANHMKLVVTFGSPSLDLQIDEQYVTPSNVTPLMGSQFIRACQFFFRSKLRNRELFFADWVTKPLAQSDSEALMLYKKSLFRSAVPVVRRKCLKVGSKVFPDEITNFMNEEVLRKTLERVEISWPDELIAMAVQYCNDIYIEIRPSLVKSFATNFELLDFYRPSRVNLPADAFETWILIYELCRVKQVKTCMYIDGYMPVPTWPVIKSPDNKDWLVGQVAAYGKESKKTIIKTGYPEARIRVIQPPFAEYYKNFKSDPFYDVMILTWIPNTVNPTASYEAPQAALRTTLELLISLGVTSIAVKLKTKSEAPYVEAVLAGLGIKADLLYGRLYTHLHKSRFVIGGISTALAECAIARIKYYAFEPIENGFTDQMVSRSSVVSRTTIARNSEELRQLLLTETVSWVAKDPEPLLNLFGQE